MSVGGTVSVVTVVGVVDPDAGPAGLLPEFGCAVVVGDGTTDVVAVVSVVAEPGVAGVPDGPVSAGELSAVVKP